MRWQARPFVVAVLAAVLAVPTPVALADDRPTRVWLSIDDGRRKIEAGDAGTYTIVVRNRDTVDARGLVVELARAAEFRFLDSGGGEMLDSGDGKIRDALVRWKVDVKAGKAMKLRVRMKFTGGGPDVLYGTVQVCTVQGEMRTCTADHNATEYAPTARGGEVPSSQVDTADGQQDVIARVKAALTLPALGAAALALLLLALAVASAAHRMIRAEARSGPPRAERPWDKTGENPPPAGDGAEMSTGEAAPARAGKKRLSPSSRG